MEYFVCPHRTRQFEIKDFWTDIGQCTHCGSISPQKFIEMVKSGKEVTINHEDKSFNVEGMTYRHNHSNKEQQKIINELYSANKINIKRPF